MDTIPQRELRNDISRILRRVEGGERLRITVAGRAVADLVPITTGRRTFVPVAEFLRILEEAPLDAGFSRDIDDALDQEIESYE